MKEYVTRRFSVGDVVRNTRTAEDGKVDEVVVEDDCRVTYLVHIPEDRFGWEMGSRANTVHLTNFVAFCIGQRQEATVGAYGCRTSSRCSHYRLHQSRRHYEDIS